MFQVINDADCLNVIISMFIIDRLLEAWYLPGSYYCPVSVCPGDTWCCFCDIILMTRLHCSLVFWLPTPEQLVSSLTVGISFPKEQSLSLEHRSAATSLPANLSITSCMDGGGRRRSLKNECLIVSLSFTATRTFTWILHQSCSWSILCFQASKKWDMNIIWCHFICSKNHWNVF